MRDPFASNSNSSMMRDAQVGLMLVALLLCLFVYVVYHRITGKGRQVPEHVRLAPIAQAVWPNGPPKTASVQIESKTTPLQSPPKHIVGRSPKEQSTRFTQSKIADPDIARAVFNKPATIPSVGPANLHATVDIAEKANQAIERLEDELQKIVKPKISFGSNPRIQKPKPTSAKPPKAKLKPSNLATKLIKPAHIESNSVRETRTPYPRPKTTPPKPLAPTKKSSTDKDNSFQLVFHRPIGKPQQDIAKTAPSFASSKKINASTVTNATETPKPLPKFGQVVANQDDAGYTTQAGDSFWSIATYRYGDGRFFHALYEWNRGVVPNFDRIPPGTKLDLPDVKRLAKRWPDLCPLDANDSGTKRAQELADYNAIISERLYITREGDTLFRIAAQELGQASRYIEIIEFNDQRLPKNVDPSQPLGAKLTLVLP